jgi:UDP-2,3-diacylglucosamine hydrolase
MWSSRKRKSLNKLVLPAGPIWLASDLHLSENTPATREAFLGFLQAAAEEAAALLLPGDIFDVWIGDDVVADPPAWLAEVLAGLKAAAARIPLYIGRGNRDFLMGERLARFLGAHLLPDSALLQTSYGPVLVTHGDQYCTDDTAYQRFRTVVRNPLVQKMFLSRSIPTRMAIADKARGKSMAANRGKPEEIMDVNPRAIEQAFRDSGVRLMVHGHTHRPARHVLGVDGRRCERWVLPDWDCDHATPPRGGWLAIDRDGPQFYDLETAPSPR